MNNIAVLAGFQDVRSCAECFQVNCAILCYVNNLKLVSTKEF